MWIFKSKRDKKVLELLRQSKQNFKFDQDQVKTILMQYVNVHHLDRELREKFKAPPKKSYAFHYAAGLVVVLFMAGTGATFAVADSAKPGDRLFSLDKFAERTVLSIPLPQQQRVRIQANIVAERMDELTKIEENQKNGRRSQNLDKATRESQESLTQAIEQLTTVELNIDDKEQTDKASEALINALTKLEELADEQEKIIRTLQGDIDDDEIKSRLDIRLQEIIKSKQKALELKNKRSKNNVQGEKIEKDERMEDNKNENDRNNSGRSNDNDVD